MVASQEIGMRCVALVISSTQPLGPLVERLAGRGQLDGGIEHRRRHGIGRAHPRGQQLQRPRLAAQREELEGAAVGRLVLGERGVLEGDPQVEAPARVDGTIDGLDAARSEERRRHPGLARVAGRGRARAAQAERHDQRASPRAERGAGSSALRR
ncbi:MAG: hypothetical protein H6712_25665 [Myxococcales bacterium]|nr:hypothetical protein [Myxococcales bacterium]